MANPASLDIRSVTESDQIECALNLDKLTKPQLASIVKFTPGVARGTHPDINPRSASALWSLGFLQSETVSGSRVYKLTDLGIEAKRQLTESD